MYYMIKVKKITSTIRQDFGFNGEMRKYSEEILRVKKVDQFFGFPYKGPVDGEKQWYWHKRWYDWAMPERQYKLNKILKKRKRKP